MLLDFWTELLSVGLPTIGGMSCSSREEITQATDGLRDAVNRWCDLAFDAITGKERLALLETVEVVTRRLHAPGHTLINQLAEQSTTKELGGRLHIVLADRLHLTRPDALRRIRDAEDLGRRTALTGETLPPKLPATATAHRDGLIGDKHITEIRSFLTHLPTTVAPDTREEAEKQLAQLAIDLRPDELHQDAAKLLDLMDPDGAVPSEEADRVRARKRGITLGKQDKDLMSRISGHIDPELRAVLEAINATLGAPGRCNRDDEQPTIDDEPTDEAARRDTRSTSQRFHDALLTAGRALLMSGTLGQHNGLPTSLVVTTTLKELEAAAGRGLTGGGTLLPMSDVIRLSRHAHQLVELRPGGSGLQPCFSRRWPAPLDAHLSPMWVDSVVTCVRSPPHRGVA